MTKFNEEKEAKELSEQFGEILFKWAKKKKDENVDDISIFTTALACLLVCPQQLLDH